jgi:signal transduction histidine kinase
MTVLGTLIARIAVILRGVALAEMVVQLVIWRSFYQASPWLLWGPVAALGWGCLAVAVLRRGRPGWRLVCADCAVYAGLALAAGWCVPVASRGEAGSWLFILVTSQIVTPVWFAPRSLAVPLAVMPGVAFAAGTALASPAHLTAAPQKASTVLLFLVVAMHCLLRRMLSGRAAAADAALAAAHQDARDQYVILSKNIERREQDRLLHDTILNTLTAIARSGGTTAALSQCRQDIGLLEAALGESGGAGAAGPAAAIEAVVGEMRARGLTVDLAVTGAAPAPGARAPGAPVPGPVVAAVAHATREALANVAAHAGTGKAWVTVAVTPPGAAAGAARIQVTVRDAGAGFDPDQVDLARLGLRRSITERLADRRGCASVESAPGKGTTVRLCWPAPRPGGPPAVPRAAAAAAVEVSGQC